MKTVFISDCSNDEIEQKTAAIELSNKGFKSIQSCRISNELHGEISDGEIAKLRISVLAQCDTLYLLQWWQASKQCELELAYARQTGKQVIYQAYSLRRRKNGTSNDSD